MLKVVATYVEVKNERGKPHKTSPFDVEYALPSGVDIQSYELFKGHSHYTNSPKKSYQNCSAIEEMYSSSERDIPDVSPLVNFGCIQQLFDPQSSRFCGS